MIKISFGNKKLPKSTAIFNIPARVTCPGKTAFCAEKCYAIKAERLYSQVLPFRQRNFEASRGPDFIPLMSKLIEKNAHKIKFFRIHESGDFYNQKYLNSWYSIAENFPAVTFYAYTKSFHLDFKARPENFVLIGSFDHSTREAARLAYESKRQFFKNTFTIIDRHAAASCVQDCSVCDLCVTGRGLKLTVNQH